MEPSILLWNRLEPSVSNESQLENALRFEVRDALWMLARQWQFGELDGEDAGTAAFARVSSQQAPISFLGSAEANPAPFTINSSPIELPIERTVAVPDLHLRMEMGRHWFRLVKKRLPVAKAQTVSTAFRRNAKFAFLAPGPGDRVDQFQQAHLMSDEVRLQTLETIAGGRMIDGFALYKFLKSGVKASSFTQPAQPDEALDRIGEEFCQWYERTYSQSSIPVNTWHLQHLEYQPQLAFADGSPAGRVLRKEEYYGDGLGWHGYEQRANWNAGQTAPLLLNASRPTNETVIPANVRFRGMPSTRLWEMEDAQVDFGSIRAASTELSKMLFAEFSLVFGSDWLTIPLQVAGGSFCRLTGLTITDSFGRQQELTEIQPDRNWSFFQMPKLNSQLTDWLFFANSDEYTQESSPIEKVLFLRDEMANIVWGVEEIVSDPTGGGRDGNRLAAQVAQLLASQNSAVASPAGQSPAEGWVYRAGMTLPENRIPFIPIKVVPGQTPGPRQVVLQRAAMPRISDEFLPVRVRPRTSILGNTGQVETNPLPPFYVFEEEIPRAGMELQLVWKRTRWLNGATLIWLAQKKAVGRGEIDSNFRFDQLTRG